jgi:5-methylcytosine-specific restriction endonuclease McrBC GTP-binding regulatory subunit McrB
MRIERLRSQAGLWTYVAIAETAAKVAEGTMKLEEVDPTVRQWVKTVASALQEGRMPSSIDQFYLDEKTGWKAKKAGVWQRDIFIWQVFDEKGQNMGEQWGRTGEEAIRALRKNKFGVE